MLDRFREHIERKGLIPPGVRVLVGYSGGADSTCLLHLLHLLETDVVAAHLHHGQRPEADKELKLCEAFCNGLGIPFASGRADVPKLSIDMKIGVEEAGREARYGFFQQAAFQTGCSLIATAHTLSDHVETILLNIARGSGLAGLSGIPEKRENIVRPLLLFSRDETRAYCEGLGFWFHDDPANEDLAFSRARVRHRILPELRSINPATEAVIARLAATAGAEDRFLDSMAAAALEQSERRVNGDLHFLTEDVEVILNRVSLSSLPPVLFNRSIRLVAEVLGASLTSEQTEILSKGVATEQKGSVTAEGGEVSIEWDEESIHARILAPAEPFRSSLEIPGEIVSDEFGWALTAELRERTQGQPQRAALETELDLSGVKGSLHFRTAKAGDTMQPFGFKGTRKLSDLLSEAKLTKAARGRLPIICDMVGCLWAPGVCLDSRAAPTSSTEHVVLLRFQAQRKGPKP
jgi:tRNA(Ile)-lysidine synthase